MANAAGITLDRVVEFVARKERGCQGFCGRIGCGKPTTHRKPRCLEHILDMPYARFLHDAPGNLLQDILGWLSLHGAGSAGRIARETCSSMEEVLRASKEAGLKLYEVRDRQSRVRWHVRNP